MPALPRHGASRGTSGHEEVDEDEDEDEDDGGPDNISPEDESDTPQSDSSTSETMSSHSSHSPSSSVSSHETFHESSTPHDYFSGLTTPKPKKKLSKSLFLPPVDMSRIDLSFLDSPPPKNKGKAKELTEDAGRTPTATVWPKNGGIRTPTAFRRMDFETETDTWAASPVVPRSSHPSSPSQTPRPGGHFKFPLPVPNTPSSARPTPTRWTTENRLSVLSINSISQFPGTYNRASSW
jgi:hypothetical protein